MQRQSYWLRKVCVEGLALGCFILTGLAAAQPMPLQVESSLAPGTFRLTVTEQEVSLEAQEASVTAIFTEIGRRTGITMAIASVADERISTHFAHVPLDEALKRLAKNVVILTAQGPDAPPHRIAKVYVLAPWQASPPEVAGSSTRPQAPVPTDATGRSNNTTSRPPPFQFTFDPSQHMQQSP